jgi:hypothetical protein
MMTASLPARSKADTKCPQRDDSFDCLICEEQLLPRKALCWVLHNQSWGDRFWIKTKPLLCETHQRCRVSSPPFESRRRCRKKG